MGLQLDFANSTSIAFQDIADCIRVSRRRALWKELVKKGKMTFEEMNSRREKAGMEPIRKKRTIKINTESVFTSEDKAASPTKGIMPD